MVFRIMVSGKNKTIASDICEHIAKDKGIKAVKCPSIRSALFEHALNDTPHLVIICLGDERPEEIKIYDVLRDCERIGLTTIVVISNDEGRESFISNTGLGRIYFLSRPVSLTALYAKIDEVREKAKNDNISRLSLFTEYINPNPVDEYIRKHILVVDDDPEQLIQIKEHIREFYDVTLVSSGSAALKYLQKKKVDLILLDFIMPGMDGSEVFVRLKETPELEDIPVVFLTGVSDGDMIKKVLIDLKPQGYLLKPVRKSELVARIIDVLG